MKRKEEIQADGGGTRHHRARSRQNKRKGRQGPRGLLCNWTFCVRGWSPGGTEHLPPPACVTAQGGACVGAHSRTPIVSAARERVRCGACLPGPRLYRLYVSIREAVGKREAASTCYRHRGLQELCPCPGVPTAWPRTGAPPACALLRATPFPFGPVVISSRASFPCGLFSSVVTLRV